MNLQKLLLVLLLGFSFCRVKAQAPQQEIFCSRQINTLPADVTGVTPEPGATYLWEVSADQQNWATPTMGTATAAIYQNFVLENTTGTPYTKWYRRTVTKNGVATVDYYYEIVTLPSTTGNQLTDPHAHFCAGQVTPVNIVGNEPIGYTAGKTTYNWQQRPVGSGDNGWADIDNQTGQNLMNFMPTSNASIQVRRITTVSSTVMVNGASENRLCFVVTADPVTIEITPPVTQAIAGAPQSGCNLVEPMLNANQPAAGETGTWSVISPAGYNPFGNINGHDPNTKITSLPKDVDIKLQWQITNACGGHSENVVTIRNNSLPVVDAGPDVTITAGNSTILNASINQPTATYTWSPATGLSNTNTLHPIASPAVTTAYSLTVTSATGCTSTDNVIVQVQPPDLVSNTIIPSGFTPNNDGVNDTWKLNTSLTGNGQVWVYNRNGERVFYSKGYTIPWDGNFNGKPLPAGVYYYVIQTGNVRKTGPVTIIR